MNGDKSVGVEQSEASLQSVTDAVERIAKSRQGDSLALLALLRTLEQLHQEIRDGLFQCSLPDNRQALYNLLKDIEASGGWPYIPRMKLTALLANLAVEAELTAPTAPGDPNA